jgi:hypothetical protein
MSNVEKLAKDLRHLLWLTIFITAGLVVISLVTGFDMDDSDLSASKRSGLKLHTDHMTGCQYFQAPNGGLAMRLNASGDHICNKQEK